MKVILVLDEMPEDCLSCPISVMREHSGENRCPGIPSDGYIPNDIYFYGRPDWCPLRPLPEKKLTWYDDDRDDYMLGWNACIDEITGEVEE